MKLSSAFSLLESPFDDPAQAESLGERIKIIGKMFNLIDSNNTLKLEAYSNPTLLKTVYEFISEYALKKPGPEYDYKQFDKSGHGAAETGAGAERQSLILPTHSEVFKNEDREGFTKAGAQPTKEHFHTVIKICNNRGGSFTNHMEWKFYNQIIEPKDKKFFVPIFDTSNEILGGAVHDLPDRRLFIQELACKVDPNSKIAALRNTFGSGFDAYLNIAGKHPFTTYENVLGGGDPEWVDLFRSGWEWAQTIKRAQNKEVFDAGNDADLLDGIWDSMGRSDDLRFAKLLCLCATKEQYENILAYFGLFKYQLEDQHAGNFGSLGGKFVILDMGTNFNK